MSFVKPDGPGTAIERVVLLLIHPTLAAAGTSAISDALSEFLSGELERGADDPEPLLMDWAYVIDAQGEPTEREVAVDPTYEEGEFAPRVGPAEVLEALKAMVNIATHPQASKAAIRTIALEARAVLAKADHQREHTMNTTKTLHPARHEVPMRTCQQCGRHMIVGPCEQEASPGVTHHLTEEGDIDYDQDANHVALEDVDQPVTVTVSAQYSVPNGTKLLRAPTGVIAGLKLPTGEVLKPWIIMELYEDAKGQEVCEDLSEDQLSGLGVITAMNYTRDITGDLEETNDAKHS